MVWFQCEDCGDNLKKPKLPNHFRQCSAFKLSCIDCGQVFGQQEVEGHTQCITEAEKYGPKGPGKASNGVNTKPQNDAKKRPEVDINVGLSERPPWFCSLCNTKATSKQTLLLHADGKKHRAKARGFHAKQQASNTVETNGSAENNAPNKVPENKDLNDSKDLNPSKAPPCDGSEVENNSLESNKKRKLDASENAIQLKGAETEVTNGLKKAKHSAKVEHTHTHRNKNLKNTMLSPCRHRPFAQPQSSPLCSSTRVISFQTLSLSRQPSARRVRHRLPPESPAPPVCCATACHQSRLRRPFAAPPTRVACAARLLPPAAAAPAKKKAVPAAKPKPAPKAAATKEKKAATAKAKPKAKAAHRLLSPAPLPAAACCRLLPPPTALSATTSLSAAL